MAVNNENFKRGTVELVVLAVLCEKDMYGYEITKTIFNKTEGLFNLPLGTLYPVLYRFVDSGFVSDKDEIINKRLRKYYHIEDKGRQYYAELKAEYIKISNGVDRIIGGGDYDEDGTE